MYVNDKQKDEQVRVQNIKILQEGDKILMGRRFRDGKNPRKFDRVLRVTREVGLSRSTSHDTVLTGTKVASPYVPPERFGQQYGGFDLKGQLGNGRFGNVYRVYNRRLGCDLAMKCPRQKPRSKEDPLIQNMELEMKILCLLVDTPFIIRIFSMVIDSRYAVPVPLMIMEMSISMKSFK